MEYKSLYVYALKCLTRRDYAIEELRQKLAEKATQTEDIAKVLNKLLAERALDDHRFAENYTQMRMRRGYGPLRIQQELRQRGVAPEIIGATLAGNKSAWLAQIAQVRRKKFGQALPKNIQEKAQQARFLQYRGFSVSQINMAIHNDDECEIT